MPSMRKRLSTLALVAPAVALSPRLEAWAAVARTAAPSVLALVVVAPASATPEGEKLFEANCAVCHAGGGNVIDRSKTLDRENLERQGYDRENIEQIVARGRGAMPGFMALDSKRGLDEAQISDIADYVEAQAAAGWPFAP
mmetsp:Transcript_3721/g.9580  ORF Transcript_3721/g.9580 Transcript_3721/m.9580 type:complete len:141 (+) Transcript_3721:48-470(+)